ncbi:MAG TPA: hypothetical protein VG456_27460 [Candidatus Sulfopaludibacter sp.]|jgi:hypothetical protein|nr:hypothetical protein [Candidatus Sulfopaludibacter sp.]
MKPIWVVFTALLLVLVAIPASAQPVISAKSGMVAKVQGTVFLGDQALEDSATHFPDIKEKQIVRTEDGLAEILLTPGVFLRLGENSSIRMVSNRLIDTRVELLTGSAVVESDDVVKDTNVTIVCAGGSVTMPKAGIYRFNTNPAQLKVYKGTADVELGGQRSSVGTGKMVMLTGDSAALQHFDTDETDFLDHWNRQRSEYVAMANVSAAKSLLSSSSTYSGLGWGTGTPCMGAWGFNSYYGMMTYIPCSGYLRNPYGYTYWSPFTVMRAYYVPTYAPVYSGGNNNGFGRSGLGYNTASATSSGYSGVMSSSPSVSSAAPASSAASTSSAASSSASAGHGGASSAGGRR